MIRSPSFPDEGLMIGISSQLVCQENLTNVAIDSYSARCEYGSMG
jgi:hypothetical protein